MDGFDQTVNVKVIMATNRADTLDPALLRPGRLDRKIEFPLPDRRQKRLVFQVNLIVELPLYFSLVLGVGGENVHILNQFSSKRGTSAMIKGKK